MTCKVIHVEILGSLFNLAHIRTASESMVITEAERKEIGPLRQPRAHGGIGGPSWDTSNTSTEFRIY